MEVGAEPGSIKGLQLVVSDIEAARSKIVGRGVDVTEVQRIDRRDGGAFLHVRDLDDMAGPSRRFAPALLPRANGSPRAVTDRLAGRSLSGLPAASAADTA